MRVDHPHVDPDDGRTECERCGKYVWPVIHSCKGIPVTGPAQARYALDGETPASERIHLTPMTDAERLKFGADIERLADGYARMSPGAVERLLTELDGETR